MKRLFSWALAAALLAISTPAQPAGMRIDPSTGLPFPKNTGPKFDINFPGGSPKDLVDMIEKISPQRPNVIIHPECKNFTISPFSLREVSAYQVFTTLNLINQLSPETSYWQRVNLDEGDVWTLLPLNPESSRPPPSQVQKPKPACKIFNLEPYLQKYTVEDITTAVQGAWDLMKSESSPSIKYHKDTKLLIVVGYIDELNVLADVLRQLEQNLDVKVKPAATAVPEAKPATAKPSR